MAKAVRCDSHKDCFANVDGRCIALKDNDFGGGECSFYKKGDASDRQEIEAACEAYAAAHGGDE